MKVKKENKYKNIELINKHKQRKTLLKKKEICNSKSLELLN